MYKIESKCLKLPMICSSLLWKKNPASFCHGLVAALGEKVTLEMVESFNNYAKAKNSAYHFWVTPKVCLIFS